MLRFRLRATWCGLANKKCASLIYLNDSSRDLESGCSFWLCGSSNEKAKLCAKRKSGLFFSLLRTFLRSSYLKPFSNETAACWYAEDRCAYVCARPSIRIALRISAHDHACQFPKRLPFLALSGCASRAQHCSEVYKQNLNDHFPTERVFHSYSK